MAVLDVIENWLSPITDPLNELPGNLDMIQQTHINSLDDFQSFVADLTVNAPPGEQWTGISAEDAAQWVQEYMASERALSAPGSTLDLVTVATNNAVSDVEVASETLAADVADDTVITEVTAAVDVADVAQAGLDPVTDLAGLILTIIDITLYFSALAAFGWAVYQATQALINALNQAENQPQPKLPKQPVALSREAEQIAQRYRQQGINVDAQTIQDMLDEGYTPDEIDQIIRNLQRLYGKQGVASALNRLLALGLSPTHAIALAQLATRQQFEATVQAITVAQSVMANAQKGKIRRAKGEHGRLPDALVQEILSNPDAVYLTTGSNPKLIFRKGDNIVIVDGSGSGRGNVITSYGPAGPRGDSGSSIYGGSPTDPGLPVTDQMIKNGQIPIAGGDGRTFPPATPILP